MAGRISGHRLPSDLHSIPGLMHASLSPATPRFLEAAALVLPGQNCDWARLLLALPAFLMLPLVLCQ